jgi:hypothetical protein
MKKILLTILMLSTLISIGKPVDSYETNNTDVKHTRIGKLGQDDYVITDIQLHGTYVTLTNFNDTVRDINSKLKNSEGNTSNRIDDVFTDLSTKKLDKTDFNNHTNNNS